MPADSVISERDFFLYVQEHRQDGEDAYDAADRLLTFYALAISDWQQKRACRLLGTSPRRMNYRAAAFRLRPKDLREGAGL